MSDEFPYSKTAIKRAGKLVRDFEESGRLALEGTPEEAEQLAEAEKLIDAWRASFSIPLLKVRMGLQSFVSTTDIADPFIGQRLKRRPRIIEKLVRYPAMQLTTMQDIGGCRVVLPDLPSLDRLRLHIEQKWQADLVGEPFDYVSNPQPSGYRGVHIVVERDDRRVEIQLRTESQHAWADDVEAVGRMMRCELKSGEGPDEVLEFFAAWAEIQATREVGEVVGEAEFERVQGLLQRAHPLMLNPWR